MIQTRGMQIAEGCIFAFAIAVITTPAGVSGAVLLLPVQVSILNVPSPAVTRTNLLYNIVATPGGLVRYWRPRAPRRAGKDARLWARCPV